MEMGWLPPAEDTAAGSMVVFAVFLFLVFVP